MKHTKFVPSPPAPRNVPLKRGQHIQCDLGEGALQEAFYDMREKYNIPTRALLKQMVEFCIASHYQKEPNKE